MKATLAKLGLRANQDNASVPSLSRLHLSSAQPSEVSEIVAAWSEVVVTENGEEFIKGENDTFLLEKPGAWSLATLAKSLPPAVQSILPDALTSSKESSELAQPQPQADDDGATDRILDYDAVVKRLTAHETSLPEPKETPYFNHHAFFANLKHYNGASKYAQASFGKVLLYGEVVTSTNTLLEK